MKVISKAKDFQLAVKVKTSFAEKIDENELNRFSRIYLRGFLKPRLIKKNLVEYTGPVGISLYESLKKPITKRCFLFILEQVVVGVQNLKANNMELNNLIMNPKYVYINEVTKEVQFIYIPIINCKNDMNLIQFIETIAYMMKPENENDIELVSRFIYFFKAMNPFDINQIEEFVKKEDRSVVNTIKKHNVGHSGFVTNKQKHYYEYYDKQQTVSTESEEDTDLLLDVDDDCTGLLMEYEDDEGTVLLNGLDDEATGLLIEDNECVKFPTLIRVLTEEIINVDKQVFRLGKEKSSVDYFISNNIAVSRSHADIISRGGRYFVFDLQSKNKSYINNRVLPAEHEVEIFNGDVLKLANEEFLFKL